MQRFCATSLGDSRDVSSFIRKHHVAGNSERSSRTFSASVAFPEKEQRDHSRDAHMWPENAKNVTSCVSKIYGPSCRHASF